MPAARDPAPRPSLNDAALGERIAVRVRSLRFPSPKGGGNVTVTCPFVFTQSGE